MLNYSIENVPESFLNLFIPIGAPNRTCSYQIDKLKKDFLGQFPSYFLPKIWNSNSLDLKMQTKLTKFKTLLHDTLISKYETVVKCKEKTCPDCRRS